MKIIYLYVLLCFLCLSCTRPMPKNDSSIQTVTRKLEYGSSIVFTVKTLSEVDKKHDSVYYSSLEGKLYPRDPSHVFSQLESATLMINNQKIDLDVTNIVNPWVDVEEFKSSDACLIRPKEDFGDNYVLHVAFCRGGGEDLIGIWTIKDNQSVRNSIVEFGDGFPDWFGKK